MTRTEVDRLPTTHGWRHWVPSEPRTPEVTQMAPDHLGGGIALDDNALVKQQSAAAASIASERFGSRASGQFQNS